MKKLSFFFFRYRFLILYIIFGFISLLVELLVARTLLSYHFSFFYATIPAFIFGLVTAFILNVRFNFHIAPPKRKKALLYFSIISTVSFLVQLLLRQYLVFFGFNMDVSRFMIAGLFFGISYLLHLRFSFREFKKVGVAIYADGVEDIKLIFNKISNVSDFIHIDIVDKTFNPNCQDVKAYRAEVVRAYWQKKKIEVHIMSRNPSIWIDDLIPYVDVIYIHPYLDEDLKSILQLINEKGCKAGIAIGVNDSIESINHIIHELSIKHILVLTIPNPGFSGQVFEMSGLSIIEKLNEHKLRSHFEICVDGGVNDQTVKFLKVESVVSGSYVLSAKNPIKNIMHLQTSGEYVEY